MADVFIQVDADAQRGLQALMSFAKQQDMVTNNAKKMSVSMKQVGKATEEVGKTGKDSISSLAGGLSGMLPAISLVGIAFKGITSTLQFMNEEAEKGAKIIEKLSESSKRLAQVSGGDIRTRMGLKKEARQLAAREGLDLAQAENLVFKMKSEGLNDKADFFSRTAPVLDPEEAVSAVGGLQSAFSISGKREGGAERLVNQLLFGAAESNKSFEQLAPSIKVAAQATKGIGSTAEETIAVASSMAGAFKGESGVERLKAYASAIAQSDRNPGPVLFGQKAPEPVGVGGILPTTETLMGMSEEERNKHLGGNNEALEAYRYLSENMPALQARFSGTIQAGDKAGDRDSLLERSRNVQLQQADVKALRNRNIEKAKLEIQQSKLGPDRLNAEASMLKRMSEGLADGEDVTSRFANYEKAKAKQFVGYKVEDEMDSLPQAFGRAKLRQETSDEALQETLDALREVTVEMRKATENINGASPNTQVE